MTFTEAAIEILRKAGKPLHFKEIASEAVSAGLLSHVGQTPEATMGARLLALSRREHDRHVMAIDTGVFALPEWGLSHEPVAVEKTQVEELRDDAAALRPKERHPQIQDEYSNGGARRGGDNRRRSEEDDASRRKKKYPPPADLAHQWLRDRGQAATLAEIAQALRASDRIAEALERDLASFEKALHEENKRRADSRRPALFLFTDDGRIAAIEPSREPRPERPPRPDRPDRPRRDEPRREDVRPAGIDEQRRNVLRSLRRRVQALDLGALERVTCAFLEATGYRELNMTRRTKDGALYLARRKWGSGELRYAIRVLKPGRELGRQEVQDLRRDLAHYSAQLGILIATGEYNRESRSESNSPGAAPVMLYGGESLAEALADAGLGATKRLVEWLEYDDEFFVSIGGEPLLPETVPTPEPAAEEPAPAAASSDGADSRDDRGRRGRVGRRDRRPSDTTDLFPTPEPVSAAPAAEAVPEPAPSEPTPTVEAVPEPSREPVSAAPEPDSTPAS